MDDDLRDLPFIRGPLAATFERRVVVVAPGQALPYREAEWRGALVVVEVGQIELECRVGGLRRFGSGDILWMDGLALRWLRNPGRDSTVLVAVSRRAPTAG